jgi:hypothetical protein
MNSNFQMNVYKTLDEVKTAISPEREVGGKEIPSSQFAYYVNHPEIFQGARKVEYRYRLALSEDKEVTAGGFEVDGLLFEHEWMAGIYVTLSVLFTLLGLFLGLLWSVRWKDPATGFTIATISGLPLTCLTVFVNIHKPLSTDGKRM